MNPRIGTVTRQVRSVIPVAAFRERDVLHYSIPAFDELGGPVLQSGGEIESDKLGVQRGDVLVSRLNPRKSRVQRVSRVDPLAIASTEFVVLRPSNIDSGYLVYLLKAETTRQALDAEVRSVTRSQQRVEPGHVLRLRVPIGDDSHQRAIADFLDRECARIDALLREKDDFIQVLVDGLDETVRAHFLASTATPVPVSRLATYVNGFPFKPEDAGDVGRPIIRIKQLTDPSAPIDRYAGTLPSTFCVEAGDLIFSWSGSIESRYWLGEDAYLNQHLFLVRPVDGVDKQWLRWTLRFAAWRFDAYMHGSAMKHITRPMMRAVRVPCPSLSEQLEEAKRFDGLERRVLKTTEFVRSTQSLLREYRDALITEAVTGQLDVSTMSESRMDESLAAVAESADPEVLS